MRLKTAGVGLLLFGIIILISNYAYSTTLSEIIISLGTNIMTAGITILIFDVFIKKSELAQKIERIKKMFLDYMENFQFKDLNGYEKLRIKIIEDGLSQLYEINNTHIDELSEHQQTTIFDIIKSTRSLQETYYDIQNELDNPHFSGGLIGGGPRPDPRSVIIGRCKNKIDDMNKHLKQLIELYGKL